MNSRHRAPLTGSPDFARTSPLPIDPATIGARTEAFIAFYDAADAEERNRPRVTLWTRIRSIFR